MHASDRKSSDQEQNLKAKGDRAWIHRLGVAVACYKYRKLKMTAKKSDLRSR